MGAGSGGQLLARVNFPPYAVRMLSSRYLLVAGGGGNAKSGIANAIEIYELSFDGVKCCARPASRYIIGDSACMNCAAWQDGQNHYLAAGLDGDCQIYRLEYKLVSCEDGESERLRDTGTGQELHSGNLRQRKSQPEEESRSRQNVENPRGLYTKRKRSSRTESADQNSNSMTSTVGFDFRRLQRFQTDFPMNKDDMYQKVVRVAADVKFIVTGGSDGHVRIWQFPDFRNSVSIDAHGDDVDDLDIHPLGNKIVSVSRDLHAYVWSAKDGKKVCELIWDPGNNVKYRCRHCRYGICEGDRKKSKLFTVHVPLARHKNSLACYLIKWDTSTYCPERVQCVDMDLSALAVSDDGRFVAIGTMCGNVEIFIAFSLQKIYSAKKCHSNFVTGLEFLPSGTEENLPIVGSQDASLISISIDNQVKIHHIPMPATINVGIFLILTVITLIGIFILMSYWEL